MKREKNTNGANNANNSNNSNNSNNTKNILIAFILNLGFSIFELIGGLLTGSVAITSDSLHDFGDAASIGASYFLERKSKKGADEKYTYGYGRYSLLGGAITTFILLFGSVALVFGALRRLLSPAEISYDGMIVIAAVGVCVNLCAALVTRDGDLRQLCKDMNKALNGRGGGKPVCQQGRVAAAKSAIIEFFHKEETV